MYETLILVDADSLITGDAIENALAAVYSQSKGAGAVVKRNGSSFKVAWPEFFLELGLSTAPHVLEESQEIALEFAKGRPEQDKIGRCHTRVELAGADDPGMDYFNDYCYVVEAIEKLGTVYTFDQGSCEFMNL